MEKEKRMLEALILKNFQAHKDTTVQLDPHITAFVGDSDVGKTAILRALYWVLQNKPAGMQMVSFWNRKRDGSPKEETSVSVEVDGRTITRVRNPDRNGYDIDGVELSAIGRDVPEQVTSFFNMSDINIARQFDRHFLLSDSAGEVARRLNELVRLDIIDRTLSKAEKRKRDARKEVEQLEEAISICDKELETYTWLDQASLLLRKRDKVIERKNALAARIQTLTKALEQHIAIQTTLKKYERVLAEGRSVLDEIEGLLSKNKQLSTRIQQLQAGKARLLQQEEALTRIAKIRPAKRVLEFLADLYADKAEQGKLIRKLEEAKRKLDDIESSISLYRKKIQEAEEQMPTVCPLCGAEMKKGE